MSRSNPMTVDRPTPKPEDKPRPRQPFAELLRRAEEVKAKGKSKAEQVPAARSGSRPSVPQDRSGPLRPLSTLASVPRAHSAAAPEALARVRSAMNVESSRLDRVRSDGHQLHDQRVDGRVLDLVLRELSAALGVEGDRSQAGPRTELALQAGSSLSSAEHGVNGGSGRSMRPGAPEPSEPLAVHPTARADAARRLVERIETFVRSQRPGLTLAVAGAINARVEVERTGPNEVALKIRGSRGVPHAEDVARIREEILSRGLHLASLSLG